jgi:hypothetical protein
MLFWKLSVSPTRLSAAATAGAAADDDDGDECVHDVRVYVSVM